MSRKRFVRARTSARRDGDAAQRAVVDECDRGVLWYIARKAELPSQVFGSVVKARGLPCSPQNLTWTDVTPEHWHHYREDPRGRVIATVRDAGGIAVGSAMLVMLETVSSEGVQTVPMLESVALAAPLRDTMAALFGFAAGRSQPGSIVVASNVSYLDPSIIKSAGARTLPSAFSAHAFVQGSDHIVETAAALNLEVI